MSKFAVSGYYARSEATFAFLVNESDLEVFVQRMIDSGKLDGEPEIMLLNAPSEFNTGMELSAW